MELARYIEHTNLSPTLTIADIDKLVAEAIEFGFYGVCVPPFWVKRAQREIGKNKITLVTVAGYPLGYSMTETKLDEIKRAIDNGADEIDVMWNVTSFKTGIPWTKIELAKCGKLCHDNEKIIKIILETSYLRDDEIIQACKLCVNAGADFVNSSTGFAAGAVTSELIHSLRISLPSEVGIKATGGVNSKQQAMTMIQAGADRLGISSGVTLVNEP